MMNYNELCEKTRLILTRKSRSTNCSPDECMYIFEKNIIFLVDVINRLPGIVTNESCGGHADKLLSPFVTYVFDGAEGLSSMAYIVRGAYNNNWSVISIDFSPGRKSEISYSFLLLPNSAVSYSCSSQNVICTYRNRVACVEDVESSQLSVSSLANSIAMLNSTIKLGGLANPRLYI